MAKGSGVTRNARSMTGAKAKQSGGEAAKTAAEPKEKTTEERIAEAASSPEKHLEYISDYVKAVDEPLQKLRKTNVKEDIPEIMSLIDQIETITKQYDLRKEGDKYRDVQDSDTLTLEERHYRFGETYEKENSMMKPLVNALRRIKNKAPINYFKEVDANQMYTAAKLALYHIGSH